MSRGSVAAGRPPVLILVLVVAAWLLAGGAPNAFAAPPGAALPGEAGVDYVDGRLLVKFQPGTGASAISAAHARAGGAVSHVIPGLEVQVVNVGAGRVPAALGAYLNNPNVLYAEPDGIAHASIRCTAEPNPPTFSNDPCSWRQWGLDNTGQNYGKNSPGSADADVDIPEAWEVATGAGMVIAILDTGWDTTHPDLTAKVIAARNFTSSNVNDVEDRHGHGTWTASIAAASTSNGAGMAGAAPGAQLLVGKVLGDTGSGSFSQIAAGIDWARAQGADVISMSLGGGCYRGPFFLCQTLQDSVNAAHNAGILVIAAAGNSGGSTEYPGAFTNVMAVAATTPNDAIASFSSIGNVAAPGVDILGAFPDCIGQTSFYLGTNAGLSCWYDYGNGTSAATPIAAGVAAIVWSAHPGLTNVQLRAALQNSATNLPGTNYDGAGRISACDALNSVAAGTCTEGGDPGPGPGNQPPVADDVSAEGDEGSTIGWTPSVSDPDAGDTLTCSIGTAPANGTAAVAPDCSSGTYTPNAGFTGGDTFTYQVSDGSASDTGTVTVTVHASDGGGEGDGEATKMHVGALSGSSVNNGSTWTAVATVTVLDGTGAAVGGATVNGSWSNGTSGSCVTNASGVCSISLSGVLKRVGSVRMDVTGITHAEKAYDSSSNAADFIVISKS